MNEIQSLQSELAALKQEFSSKIQSLENRLSEAQAILPVASTPTSDFHPEPSADDNTSSATPIDFNPEPIVREPEKTQSELNTSTSQWAETKGDLIPLIATDVVKTSVIEFAAPMLAPFFNLIGKLADTYRHYQEQGKTPVFFMTIAGISALVLGFGYLLQFSFTQYFTDLGKVLFGYVIAITITVGGIQLTRKKNNMMAFGSSIIGLGIILGYLCTYFVGPYYSLIPPVASLVLLFVITGCGYVAALLFQTRIVAVVSLVGGSFSPVILGQIEQPPHIYFSYLLILVTAMMHLSQRINWQPLAHTSMLLSVGLIQFCLWDLSPTTNDYTLSVFLMHCFFYVFSYFSLHGIKRFNEVSKTTVLIVSGNLIFLLVVLEQLVSDPTNYGYLLLVNGAIWVVCAIFPLRLFPISNGAVGRDIKKHMQSIMLLSAGVLMGVGFLVLVDPEFVGLIWGIEGLVLLYLGSRFAFYSVRIEAYVVLAIALSKTLFTVLIWVTDALQPLPVMMNLEFDYGWMNLFAATILVIGIIFVLKTHSAMHLGIDHKVFKFSREFLSICISATFLLTIGIVSSQWMWVFAIVPMLVLIYYAKRQSLTFTEYFGFAHYLLLLVPILVSAELANSFRFMEQSDLGKVVRIEAFLSLWVIAEFYNKIHPQGKLIQLALFLRQTFYCLMPVFFLPSIFRNHVEYFPLVVWGSSLLSLYLFSRYKYKSLKIETIGLVILSSVTVIISSAMVKFDHWEGAAMGGLLLGVGFYSLVLWILKGFEHKPSLNDNIKDTRISLQLLLTFALYYYGIVGFVLLYAYSGLVELGTVFAGIYFTLLLIIKPTLNPLRGSFSYAYISIWLLLAVTTITFLMKNEIGDNNAYTSSFLLITAWICTALLVYVDRIALILVQKKLGGFLLHQWVFHSFTVFIYVGLINYWFSARMGPALSVVLVVHATIVLFQTLNIKFQRLIWIAICLFTTAAFKILYFDMRDFSLVEKIIAFMVIGALLLGAAYQYQKIRRVKEVLPI